MNTLRFKTGVSILAIVCQVLAIYPARGQTPANIVAHVQAYCDTLLMNPILNPIRKKTKLGSNARMTFDMLTINQLATDAEKPVIRDWANIAMACTDETKRIFDLANAGHERLQMISRSADTTAALRAQLHNGQLSWGKFNQEMQRVSGEFQAAWNNLNAALEQRSTR